MTVVFQPAALGVSIGQPSIRTGFGEQVVRDYVERDPFEGPYSITPGENMIKLETDSLRMTGDITVEPIPDNYCRWRWDGSVLTVY